MTHTPTPWKITSTPDQVRAIGIDASNWFEIGDDEGTICSARGRFEGINGANASFIVSACNAHDALVEALEFIVRQVKTGKVLERDACITAAVDALKLARGEV